MTPPKPRGPVAAPPFPPRLQALLDEHGFALSAALTDATGPHVARVTLPPAICTARADGAVTWRLTMQVDLVLPDNPTQEVAPMPNPVADGQRRRAPPPVGRPKPPIETDGARKGAIAKIHIARGQLGMGDDAYRDMLERLTGERTAGTLSMPQLEAVLAEMKRLGFKPLPATRSTSPKAQIRMIFAVWKDLQPHLQDASDEALRAFCARQTKSPKHPNGVSAPQFLGPHEAGKVLEGLKAWLARCRTRARLTAEARAEGMGQ